MPDTHNRLGEFDQAPEPPRDWATVYVPRGVTSLAAAKRAMLVPADIDGIPVQILDPTRKRVRCDEAPHCWSEAHAERQLDGEPVFLCSRHARMWDREPEPDEDKRVNAQPDAVPSSEPRYGDPDPETDNLAPPTVYKARTQAWLAEQGFEPVPRKDMPSRSKEARHAEWERRKARQGRR
jgi:hypothetical protein